MILERFLGGTVSDLRSSRQGRLFNLEQIVEFDDEKIGA